MKKIAGFLFILLNFYSALSQPKIIFDTDIGGDADDLAALAMLHNFAKRGDCDLLAVMCWSTEEYAVPAIDAMNRYYHHPDIPIGTRKGATFSDANNYNKAVAQNFSYKYTASDVPDATALYRKLLAKASDTSITIVAVGPLLNIENLLKSQPDNFSALGGKELVRQKVKEFVIMGGHFPKGENEWNFNGNMPGVTKYVLENIPSPIVYSGFEIGVQIKTGAILNDLDKDTPLYHGFLYFSEHAPWIKDQFKGLILDNSSFDQTAVLYAVWSGEGVFWDKVKNGICVADEKGNNKWVKQKNSIQSYLKLTESPELLAKIIEMIMLNRFEELPGFN